MTTGPNRRPTGAAKPPSPQPGLARLLGRGLTRRCPACGQGRLFRRLTMVEACPRCGLRFERIDGHWIGAVGINTIVSFGLLLVIIAVGMFATYPDFAVGRLVAITATVALVGPAVFHPVAKTLWTAIDIAFRPLEADEIDWTQVG